MLPHFFLSRENARYGFEGYQTLTFVAGPIRRLSPRVKTPILKRLAPHSFTHHPMKRTYPTDRLAKIGLFVNAGGPAPTPALNALPEVQAILAKQFGGRPIGSANLRAWVTGGYQDWLNPLLPSPPKPRRLSPQKARAQTRKDFAEAFRDTFAEVTAEKVFGEIETGYGYAVQGDWQRGRCAVLATLCAEFVCLAGPLPAAHLAKLLLEKYTGLPLGRGVNKLIRFHLSRTSLDKALRTWRTAATPGPEIFTAAPRPALNPAPDADR